MEKTKFIVLDEPFNGIERETVTRIKDYLKSLKDKGVTIIISSHIKEDLNELQHFESVDDYNECKKIFWREN